MIKTFFWIVGLFGKKNEKGAESIINLAISEEVDKITGKYFVNKKIEPSSRFSYDKEKARELWAKSEEICGIKFEI